MTPSEFLSQILDPGLKWCAALPGWYIISDDRVRVLMLAIAGQESSWKYRVQGGNGPAHSYWQDEMMGAVHGVLTHPASTALARVACEAAHVAPQAEPVWELFATPVGDHLAVAFARLLLLTDPTPLPVLGAVQPAASYYRRNWRPGKYRPNDWPGNYASALHAVTSRAV
jgi:hypothetical protein